MDIDLWTLFCNGSERADEWSRNAQSGKSQYAFDGGIVLGTTGSSDGDYFDRKRLKGVVLLDILTCILYTVSGSVYLSQ